MKKTTNRLIEKFLANELNLEDAVQLKEWMQLPENQNFLKKEVQLNHLLIDYFQEFDAEKAYEEARPITVKPYQVYQLPLRRYWKYAAVFIALIGIVSFFFNSSKSDSNQLIIADEVITLELEDGTIKEILPDDRQIIKNKNGATASIKQGDTLLYSSLLSNRETEMVYHILRVPHGKTHKLMLSDGSYVHLNSGSTLRFPKQFRGKERNVYLEGEAYFIVEPNPNAPFIVSTLEINVQVLGTAFNVSAYTGENIETVLLEGSVALKAETGRIEKILKPGEMGSWMISQNDIVITEVNTKDYIAWTKGVFLFHKKPFEEILILLERKYNVKIENHYSELDKERFKGNFDEESIEEIMETFTKSRLFDYEIKDNKIIIQKPNSNS